MNNKELLRQIAEFCNQFDPPMAPTRFGMEAVKDPSLINELTLGRELRETTKKRVLAYIKTGKRQLRTA